MVTATQIRVFLLEILVFLRHEFEIVEGYPISIWQVFLFVECFAMFINVVQRAFGKSEVV